ncbi:hypothetical protein MSG28_015140 [Choristoneura fumiferana]|uniref:Uncharacterized protein n=1 Tax=Choristoneura fumiferana TaxID=7141 RepID=A0ACC0KYI2_CHOFU|nr:hypothetical protein MSG28_015140 [Choristoneura fumiferana]
MPRVIGGDVGARNTLTLEAVRCGAERKRSNITTGTDSAPRRTAPPPLSVWSLLGHENKQSEPIYENESKQIRCLNALSLNCCAHNQRTVLIVCAKYCQIYDAGDFSVLCSIQAPSGERWMSGDFLAPDRVLVWSTEGKGYLYKLPAKYVEIYSTSVNSVPDHKGFHGPTVAHDSPVLFGLLAHPDNKLLSCPPAMRYVITSVGGKQRRLLLRGDSAGTVSVWSVDEAATPAANSTPSHAPVVLTSLDMAWAEMSPSPVGILDQLHHPSEPGKYDSELSSCGANETTEGPPKPVDAKTVFTRQVKLTASIYLLAANRLVVGREDGSIVIVNATHTVQLQLLHGNHQQLDDDEDEDDDDDDEDEDVFLFQIGPRINCCTDTTAESTVFFIPITSIQGIDVEKKPFTRAKYDRSHLVSGGIDFAVCLWDLFSGQLLHRFCVHAGEITQLIVPPTNCSVIASGVWRPRHCLCVHAGEITQLIVPPTNCSVIASGVWRPRHCLCVHAGEITQLIVPPTNCSVIASGVWRPRHCLCVHAGEITQLIVPPTNCSVIASGVWRHRHCLCVHAGEITQLIVPPTNCSPRIQKCICSVASDHSVTLLSLSERKCVTLASRHLFPVVSIKWRPGDDFMVVGCSDGTVYVWQMETGHLDRVLHGMIAEEVLAACDETLADDLGGSLAAGSGDLQGLANPAVHFFRGGKRACGSNDGKQSPPPMDTCQHEGYHRGLRHRNVAAMRAATQRGLAALQAPAGGGAGGPLAEPARARRAQLTVQGFRSNPKDPESHILFFDIEGLIVELLSEEYSAMSPASLEAAGLITSEYMTVAALTRSASPDATKRISGILAKMKEGAETVQVKLQAKAEQLKHQLEAKGKWCFRNWKKHCSKKRLKTVKREPDSHTKGSVPLYSLVQKYGLI